jgi:hypothetical protein
VRRRSLLAAALLLVPSGMHAQSQCRNWAPVPGASSPLGMPSAEYRRYLVVDRP